MLSNIGKSDINSTNLKNSQDGMDIMKKGIILFTILLLGLSQPFNAAAEVIEVLIKGIDNGTITSRDRDYKEAVMNAKLQAIERAGVSVKSITKVENFKLKYDMVESKASAVLLPGFQIIDMGYQKDGTYQIVLSGKVQTGETLPQEGRFWGKLRFQPQIFKSYKEARDAWMTSAKRNIDNQYVNNEDGTVTDSKTGLMWTKSYKMKENIAEVKKYIEELNKTGFAGFSDWRIPTLDELGSIVENKPAGKLDGGRQSHLDAVFDLKPYCWYLWSADSSGNKQFLAYIGEKDSRLSFAGDHYQSEGICVACIKAIRSLP